MSWRHVLTAAVMAAALITTGCAKEVPSTPGAPSTPTNPPAETPTAPARPDGVVLTAAPKDAVLKSTVNPGEQVKTDVEGLYLIDPATGRTEIWSVPGHTADVISQVGVASSQDGTYVIARKPNTGYLVLRSSGAAYQFDRSKYELVAASASALLFEQMDAAKKSDHPWYAPGWGPGGLAGGTGKYLLFGSDLKHKATFDLPGQANAGAHPALFSPDYKRLALVTGADLHLIDLATGQVLKIAQGLSVRDLTNLGGGKGFVTQTWAGDGTENLPRTFNWEGTALAILPAGTVAPHGSLVVYTQFVGGLTPAAVVVDAAGKPVFRVLGADLCYGSGGNGPRWLADSSAFFARTQEGNLTMTSRSGSLSTHPATRATGWHEVIPSPFDAKLVADQVYGTGGWYLAIADDQGNKRQTVDFAQGGLRAAGTVPLWQESGKYLQLSYYQHGGGDGPCGDYSIPLPPKVQQAPYPADLQVAVQNTDDCLNVRAEPSRQAQSLACVKDGTVLTVTAPDMGYSPLPAQTWNDDTQWIRVRTPNGNVGWATLSDGYLKWAD